MDKVTSHKVLKALRAQGITARSGFDPNRAAHLECANAYLLDNVVINVNTFSVLDNGGRPVITHRDYKKVQQELADKVEAGLKSCGVEYRKMQPDQFWINGYKLGEER